MATNQPPGRGTNNEEHGRHPASSLSLRKLPIRGGGVSLAAMPGVAASTTLQYTGIAVFVAIVLYVVLYYSRSFNSVFLTRRHGATNLATGAGDDAARPGPVQALGLGPDDVAVLPTFTYHAAACSPDTVVRGNTKAAASVAADCCAVCLDELRDGALVRMLASCKHYFHAECVDVWLLSHATCPVCRGSLGQEMVRLGVASLSPPLPQLRLCVASSAGERDVVSLSSPSPVMRSPMRRFEVSIGNGGSAAMSPSPTHRPCTPPEGRAWRTMSLSLVTTGANGVVQAV